MLYVGRETRDGRPVEVVDWLRDDGGFTRAYFDAETKLLAAVEQTERAPGAGQALSILRLIPTPPGKIVSGEIVFNGRDLLKLDESQIRKVRGNEIAMVFQEPMTSLNPVLTIGRQMTEALELHMNLHGKAARTRAADLLEMVGIPEARRRLDDYPHQFSGGMRQRVMIAMAMSCNPKLLLADVRGGRYVDAVTRGGRLLGMGELTRAQLGIIHRQLTEAYAALEAPGLAAAACAAWRENDPKARLDPMMLSPKIMTACMRGQP